MQTPASIARHPIHPMLVPIPIGLWIFSFVCDLVYRFGGAAEPWTTIALYSMVGGILGALLAAVPGLIDLLSLPEGPRATAIKHMALNLTIVALYILVSAVRYRVPKITLLRMGLNIAIYFVVGLIPFATKLRCMIFVCKRSEKQVEAEQIL